MIRMGFLKDLKYYASVAVKCTRLSMQTELEYPFMLAGNVLANVIQWVVGFATIKFVVDQFGPIGGWGMESLAFLYGMSVLSHGLAILLYIQTWHIGHFMIHGVFDMLLLHPMDLLFQFLFMDFNLFGVTDMIPGFMVFFYGCAKVHFAPNFTNILLVLLTLAGGTMIRGAVWMFCGSLAFWTKSTADFTGVVGELFERVSMYPLTIYPKWTQWLFTFVLPLAWITFYPVKDILGLSDTVIPVPMAVVTFGVGLVMFVASCLFFRVGMGHYESAGS